MEQAADPVDDDVEVSAVIAHGLLNTLAVISGAAATMRGFGDALSPEQRETMTAALVSHSELFTEGLDVLMRHCSDRFADAAWVVESIGRRFRAAPADDQTLMLDRLEGSTAVLRDELRHLVAGLPRDVIDLLDSMQRP